MGGHEGVKKLEQMTDLFFASVAVNPFTYSTSLARASWQFAGCCFDINDGFSREEAGSFSTACSTKMKY